MSSTAEVVICGAGISGIATAYHLAVTHGVKHVVLIDERPPLTLTSDKSSEAYRNWWPDAADGAVDESQHRLAGTLGARKRQSVPAESPRLRVFHRRSRQHRSDFHAPRKRCAGWARVKCAFMPIDRTYAAYAPIDPHGFDEQPDGR